MGPHLDSEIVNVSPFRMESRRDEEELAVLAGLIHLLGEGDLHGSSGNHHTVL